MSTYTSDAAHEAGTSSAALSIRGMSKRFGATRALDDVSFDIQPGTIHGFVGGNGSGKSTLIKILAGVYEADEGAVVVNGVTYEAKKLNPLLSRDLGLRFVHQQPSTFLDLSVAENLAIGARAFQTGFAKRVRWRAQKKHAQRLLDRFQIKATPDTLLRELNPASQTMVAIARALQDRDASEQGVLVLDEPTASLPLHEVQLLLGALKRYAAEGQTIVYVSHRLEEITELADRVTVLRDGKLITTTSGDLSQKRLVELITGRTLEELSHQKTHVTTDRRTLLNVEGLVAGAANGASFTVGEGEIVGLAGLLGSGRSSILRSLFGDRAHTAGTITLDGSPFTPTSPREAMEAGVAFVPEDRNGLAAFLDMSVTDNLGIADTRRYFVGGRMRHRAERKDADKLVADFCVKTGSLQDPLGSLSGGNAQKVILARWLRREPRLILLDEPSQGVDFGARSDIWRLVSRAVGEGSGALVVSSDFEELASVCDRVLIVRGGAVCGELTGDDVTEHNIDRSVLMGGH